MKPFRLTILLSFISLQLYVMYFQATTLPGLHTKTHARGRISDYGYQAASGQQNFELRVKLLGPMTTRTVKRGEDVTAQVLSPPEFVGDFLEGTVTESKSAGSIKGTAMLTFTFTKLTHKGKTFNIDSTTKSIINPKDRQKVDEEGNVTKSTNNTGIIAGTAAAGAATGAIAGGGKEAAIGAGAGALTGLIIAKIKNRGTNVTFDTQSEIVIAVHRCDSCPVWNSINNGESSRPALRKVRPRLDPNGSPATSSLPALPASSYRIYNYLNYCSFNLPTNWQEFSNGNTMAFSPKNGYSISQRGTNDYSYGTMIGSTKVQNRDLKQGTAALTASFINSNTGMKQQGQVGRVTISGREAMMVTLIGKSTLGRGAEIITVYTAILRNGSMLYIITIVPEGEQQNYKTAFATLINSIRFND